MKKHLILIVDDNPVNIQLLVNILEADFELVVAKSGTKALKILEQNQADLILLDINMPEMDGYEVCRRIKNNSSTQETAIIFISAMSESHNISKGFAVGAVDYITKPFNSAEVTARVKTHLSLSKMRKTLNQNNISLKQKVTEKTLSLQNELEYRKKIEEDILHQAYYDDLTDLPNRKLLLDRLEQALITSRRHHHYGAVIFLDLDRFKSINDSLGHSIGDSIIIEAAKRIKSCVWEEDTASRFGGDEYVILLRHVGKKKELASIAVQKVASCIQDKLSQVYLIDDHELYLTSSIGITLFPFLNQGVDDIIRHADTAMYSAKENGRNQIAYYFSQMHEKAQKRLLLEKDLRGAIKEKQLDVYYQPQINQQGKLIAVEALIRWKHPEQGFVNPEEFIAIAEDTGLIYDIGDFVLNQSISDILKINKQHNISLGLSVNISPQQFKKSEFSNIIKSVIEIYQLEKGFLTLELTERSAMDAIHETIKKMRELKRMGIYFSLDDFGTGYSSLSHLKQLPIDELKIDKSFISDIEEDPEDVLLIQTIIKIGHQFSLKIVAEGVETEEQLEFLKGEDCNIFQGYFYSPALPFEKLKEYTLISGISCNQ
ncbi:MAG: EAL domain-containing protein [gamma proteobacterium symbiont of Taylorina sp.]|nr:EAL domain-containing protein [gamma proteobacterium symbiont of Taylorina sp.]